MDTLTIGMACGCSVTVFVVNGKLDYVHGPCDTHLKSLCLQDILPQKLEELCHLEFN